MRILIDGYIYESVGVPYTNEDVKELLESHNVESLDKLNLLLEAIDKKNEDNVEEEEEDITPDLEPTPEEKAEEDKMAAAQQGSSSAIDNKDLEPQDPSKSEPPIPADEPVEPEEPKADVEPAESPEPTPAPSKEPKKPLSPPMDPPALPPKETLPEIDKAPSEWLPSKKLSTLYNNFIDFFDGDKSLNAAGSVIGLEAPGLKQDSKYLQCDITAFVQGSESKPYSTWIKLRRQRNTQDWSFNNPCEVRCSCKAFAYYVANSNLKNKSLAGTPIKGKTYIDNSGVKRTLNFLLPAPKNNPAAVPALCKHLALVAKELLNNGMISEN